MDVASSNSRDKYSDGKIPSWKNLKKLFCYRQTYSTIEEDGTS